MPYTPGDILLDKYRIEKTLGHGAFGEVYLVKHTILQVQRAVKVLKHDAPGIGSTLFGDAQARFLLESRLGARLNSPISNPHLLQVFDCYISDELCLLEMEYASGGSLAARMEQARATNQLMPVETALQITLEVAGGLAGLHANDIVHRDLKPSNILFDDEGHAHLGDLGLAQVPGGENQRSQLSNPEPHPGTPAYMSPEQENSGKLLTPPSDVYALGLVLFEMLTGRNYRLLKPGTRAASLREDLPLAVDDLLFAMLARDPEQRPWDGEKTAVLLQAVADGKTPAGAVQWTESQAAESERLAQEAEKQRRKQSAEQARQLAELKARKLAAERQALLAVKEARRERERSAQEAEKPQSGFLERNWLGIALAGLAGLVGLVVLALLLGWYLISRASPATDTPMPMPTPTPGIGSTFKRSDGMLDLYVPEGLFWRGSEAAPDEQPVQQIYLDAFWIDQTDVTNAMYAVCVQSVVCQPVSDTTRYGDPNFASHPVTFVTWEKARTYCEWVGGRLPTEAEWEKAARGTDGKTYPWGEKLDGSYANYDSNLAPDTTAVGSYDKGKSPYGAQDMAGNVWQWVADWAGSYDPAVTKNPTGPAQGERRVIRGESSWRDDPTGGGYYSVPRSALRFSVLPSVSSKMIGFRCVVPALH